MTSRFNLLLAGVGGQGIVLTSRLLMEDAMLRGSEARGSETHGMAQRGGSVVAHVRLGPCLSPLIIPGTADLLVSLEAAEGLRNLRYLREGGTFLVNAPGPDFLGDEIASHLAHRSVRIRALDASKMALEMGHPLSVNMIMAGCAAAHPEAPFTLEGLRTAAERVMRPRFLEAGLRALDAGHAAGSPGPAARQAHGREAGGSAGRPRRP